MRIRKPLWFGLLALAAVGVVVVVPPPPAEPIVNGHPLTYWIDQISPFDESPESPESIQSALSAMDDRCVRVLIHELNWRPSPLIDKVNDLSGRWCNVYQPIHERPDRRLGAALVLSRLGSRATNAIPALERASHRSGGDPEAGSQARGGAIAALVILRHESVEVCAKRALDYTNPVSCDYSYAIIYLGTNAASAVPLFADAARTATDSRARVLAAQALGLIHSQPELSLPALTSLLKETSDPKTRIEALWSLKQFGSSAKPVWNDLPAYLNDPDGRVRKHAADALWKIDPVSAKQLGLSPSP